MIKLAVFSLVATVTLAASSAFAGDMACCATKAGKMECSHIYAKLSLTPDKKRNWMPSRSVARKMAARKRAWKGSFPGSERRPSEQYAQLKSGCGKMQQQAEKPGS